MIVTYVYHSCCAIEFDAFSVIIDYYKDAFENVNGIEKGWVKDYLLKKEKPLYVLCTHSHADHFNPEILFWDKDRADITYVFSKEIEDTFKDTMSEDKVHYLDKLQTFEEISIFVN